MPRCAGPCGGTGEAVLVSATTVVLALLTLLLSAFPTTRGLGLAGAVGIVVAAGYALVVLPATLVLFGRWVFWPLVPRVGQVSLTESRSFWRRVGDRVAARPGAFVVVTCLLLAGARLRAAPDPHRAVDVRPVPAQTRGHRGGRAAGPVLPRRQL